MTRRRSKTTAIVLLMIATAATAAAGGRQSTHTVCRNGTGMHDGYFYSFFRDAGTGCLRLGRGGRYATTWSLGASGNLVAGKGWAIGSVNRTVRYAAHFTPGANGYLSLYGWSTDPLVEYYVVENWGDFVPPGGAARPLGIVTTDGGTYRIYRTRRIGQPSIVGTADFDQYWSVRVTRVPSGRTNRITFANHVAAWRNAGLTLGTMKYQVLATEGFGSNGRSDVTVLQGSNDPGR